MAEITSSLIIADDNNSDAVMMSHHSNDRIMRSDSPASSGGSSTSCTGSTADHVAVVPVVDDEQPIAKGGVACPFPWKVHDMLDAVEEEGLTHVVSWQSHGRSFLVHQPKAFVGEIMPRFFSQTKFASFQRQLNLYGFSRFNHGRDKGAYYHPHFLRGKRSLVRGMIRRKIKGNKTRRTLPAADEPDFYDDNKWKNVVPAVPAAADVVSCEPHQRQQERPARSSSKAGRSLITPPDIAPKAAEPEAAAGQLTNFSGLLQQQQQQQQQQQSALALAISQLQKLQGFVTTTPTMTTTTPMLHSFVADVPTSPAMVSEGEGMSLSDDLEGGADGNFFLGPCAVVAATAPQSLPAVGTTAAAAALQVEPPLGDPWESLDVIFADVKEGDLPSQLFLDDELGVETTAAAGRAPSTTMIDGAVVYHDDSCPMVSV